MNLLISEILSLSILLRNQKNKFCMRGYWSSQLSIGKNSPLASVGRTTRPQQHGKAKMVTKQWGIDNKSTQMVNPFGELQALSEITSQPGNGASKSLCSPSKSDSPRQDSIWATTTRPYQVVTKIKSYPRPKHSLLSCKMRLLWRKSQRLMMTPH